MVSRSWFRQGMAAKGCNVRHKIDAQNEVRIYGDVPDDLQKGPPRGAAGCCGTAAPASPLILMWTPINVENRSKSTQFLQLSILAVAGTPAAD